MASDGMFKSIQDSISACLVDTTRTAGQIAGEDLAFQRSSNPSIGPLLDTQNTRLLNIARVLIESAVAGTGISPPELPNAEAVDDGWRGIVDVVDNLLERADACLDEYTGVIKRTNPTQKDTSKYTPLLRKQKPAKAYQDQNIPKPQLLFNTIPTNNETAPFIPLLRTKPNAIVPLEQSLDLFIPEDGLKEYDTHFYLSMRECPRPFKELINTLFRYKHPYETEINQARYPPSTYLKVDPIPFLPFESTTATYVDTPEAMLAMLAELKTAKEIAVDLEHHDTHSYIGLVSLMQISTREKDWVIDTLKPWREDLQVLNEVFTDPQILKVFHGATMDMIWLQRDLGLYVVGLFDTYHASRLLGYPKKSLAYLLTRFAKFNAEKEYQLADWRIRPLPERMFNYARSDTHFLLYVYDNMRNELIDKSMLSQADGNLVDAVLEDSKKEALQRYERPFYDTERGSGPTGWYYMLVRTPALFTKEQFAVFRAVHHWRDSLARKEDESLNAIMSKTALFNIAREMPMDMPSLLGCSHPISAILRLHAGELLGKIRQAKIAGAHGPEMKELLDSQSSAFGEKSISNKPLGSIVPTMNSMVSRQTIPLRRSLSDTTLRTNNSHFWGSTFLDGASQKGTKYPRPQNLRLALPLPQLTAEIFTSTSSGLNNTAAEPLDQPGPRAEHQYVKDRKPTESDVFVVKEMGGSRKRKSEQVEDPPEKQHLQHRAVSSIEAGTADSQYDEMEISLSVTDEARLAREKAERRAERKVQKKLEKEQRKAEEAQRLNGTNEEAEVFDYASAPSVLHANKDNVDRPGSKKPFQPYSKSLDAPKSMRKSNKEIAGKSITFRS